MRRRAVFTFAVAVCLGFAVSLRADPPAGYYDSVNQATLATFRQTLHDVIDDHTRFPYTSSATDTWNILEEADEDPENSSNILDLYRNTSLPKQGGGNSFYNREHSWPKSYGFPNDHAGNYSYTDCHALFLCDSGHNNSRSNKPYRSCTVSWTEKATEETGRTGVFPGNSNWTGGAHEWVGCIFGTECVTPPHPQSDEGQSWRNELHYQNDGADHGEFVEIVGRAGTNMSDWSLVGSNGRTGALYRIISLFGQITDQSNGFGAVAFSRFSIRSPHSGESVDSLATI